MTTAEPRVHCCSLIDTFTIQRLRFYLEFIATVHFVMGCFQFVDTVVRLVDMVVI